MWVKARIRRTRKRARISIKQTAKERAKLIDKNRSVLRKTYE